MVTGLFIALAIFAAGLTTELIAACRAPLGYQDESGFHFGNNTSWSPRPVELEKTELTADVF
jgi:hypothetical protein